MTESGEQDKQAQTVAAKQLVQLRIWVDADACPGAIKEVIFRTANRLKIETTLVANQSMRIPSSEFIKIITVPHGADVADQRIVDLMRAGDLVITGDIPLAARAVEKGGVAIGTRGELFDDDNVHSRLASRNLMEHLRSSGMETSGPKPQSQKDVQTFSNQLDRMLTKLRKKRPPKTPEA
ncbi:MAG: YaiI/YqxD family protein [Mariniblastus sp.]